MAIGNATKADCIKPTSRDIQEIVSKLYSATAKARKEGIELLNSWLEGDRSYGFCEYIGKRTAALKPKEIPHDETWPFLVKLLIECIKLEIDTSKKRPPKLIFAKTLRVVVQRAEDVNFSAGSLFLLPVAQYLFDHIMDVLSDVPSFHLEYGTILRHLIGSRHYKFHMRKRVYGSLVLLYMKKVETSLSSDDNYQTKTSEEISRSIQTLHTLLENPPRDFPDNLQKDIVKGFVGIFSYVRKDGKIARKLVECINTYLLKDGPNLGCQSLELHHSVQQFILHSWSTTHDPGVKDSLILYARLQLNLTRGGSDESILLEQLMDVIGKELDQSHTCNTTALRDNKPRNLTTSECGLVDLAALVFYRACVNTSKPPEAEKRVKREHPEVQLKGRLMKGKWLWNATFCYIMRNYHKRLSKDLLIRCFKGICVCFERIINDATKEHAYNDLLWTLRSLQGLSSLLLVSNLSGDRSSGSSFATNEVVLVANSLPALNDVTAMELPEIVAEAAKHCDILRRAAVAGGLLVDAMISSQDSSSDSSSSVPLMVVENGCGSPCIDLRQVSSELAAAAKDADLIILEGMGRSLHTNYNAKFKCDALKLAMVKNQRLAEKLIEGNIYDCVCRYEPAN